MQVKLAGRDLELIQLEGFAEEVLRLQRPLVVVILGPTGIGKRRLITELIRGIKARNQFTVCRGYSEDSTDHRSYRLIQRIIRNRYRFQEDAPLGEQLETIRTQVRADFQEESEQILSMLATVASLHDLTEQRTITAQDVDGRGFSFATLKYYLEREAHRRPLLLTVEGLQNAGDESLELFSYLAASLSGSPILLLVSATPALLDRLELAKLQQVDARIIELAPLPQESSASLLDQLLEGVVGVPPELSGIAHERTGGSPALIVQFARSLIASDAIRSEADGWRFIPEAFDPSAFQCDSGLIAQARLEHLASEERMLLTRAAVMGSCFWLEGLCLLARSSNRREGSRYLWRGTPWLERIRNRVETLVERGLLIHAEEPRLPGEEAYRFLRLDEQQRLYRLLNADELRRHHFLLAQWLEQTQPDQPEPPRLQLLAHHLLQAQLPERAAHCLLAAGRAAAALYQKELARTLLTEALELCRTDDALFTMEVLFELGDLATSNGDLDQALSHFTTLLEWAWLLDHRRKGGVAYNRLGRIQRTRGNLDRAMDSIMTAWGLFESDGDIRGVATCMDDVGQLHWLRGHQEEALDHYRRSLELRQELDDQRGIALSLHNIGTILAERGQYEEALDTLTEALESRKALGYLNDVISSLNTVGMLYRNLGQPDRASDILQEALTLVKETGELQREAELLLQVGDLETDRGNLLQAKICLDQALALARRLDDPFVNIEGLRLLARATLYLKEHEEANALGEQALQKAQSLGNPVQLATTLRCLAEIAETRGDLVAARIHLEKAADLLESATSPPLLVQILETLAVILERLGAVEAAWQARARIRRIGEPEKHDEPAVFDRRWSSHVPTVPPTTRLIDHLDEYSQPPAPTTDHEQQKQE